VLHPQTTKKKEMD